MLPKSNASSLERFSTVLETSVSSLVSICRRPTRSACDTSELPVDWPVWAGSLRFLDSRRAFRWRFGGPRKTRKMLPWGKNRQLQVKCPKNCPRVSQKWIRLKAETRATYRLAHPRRTNPPLRQHAQNPNHLPVGCSQRCGARSQKRGKLSALIFETSSKLRGRWSTTIF